MAAVRPWGRRASLTRTSARALASTHRARAPDQGSRSLAWARVLSLDRTFFTPTIAITITHPTRRGGESLGFIRVCVGSQLVSKSDPVYFVPFRQVPGEVPKATRRR